MEHLRAKNGLEVSPPELAAQNDQVLWQRFQELHTRYDLSVRSLARILHVDKGWVAGALRRLKKENFSQ